MAAAAAALKLLFVDPGAPPAVDPLCARLDPDELCRVPLLEPLELFTRTVGEETASVLVLPPRP